MKFDGRRFKRFNSVSHESKLGCCVPFNFGMKVKVEKDGTEDGLLSMALDTPCCVSMRKNKEM